MRRRLGLLGTWFTLGLGIALVLALALPLAFQARPLTVLSGSMEPTLMTGDVVVVRERAPMSVRPGDILTFRSPQSRQPITHRVRRMQLRDGVVHFVTKGDANKPVERWQIQANKPVRRVAYRIPLLGYALNLLRTKLGLVLLVGVPVTLLTVLELVAIWRPRREASGEAAA